jgi:hypothetical protein
MYGVSKLIMDKAAYEKINTFYTRTIDSAVPEKQNLSRFFGEFILGKAFYSMIKEENNKHFREARFMDASKNIYSLSLLKDRVIPPSGTNSALCFNEKRREMAETIDFPFEYCHETPFPVLGKMDKNIVDYWFGEVFWRAAEFFN